MDEILIEEKRYISSKQAAKITGYAKDYIGQLCREGRVPARLVGRSWYVLEAAIQDHRFGAPAVDAEEKKKPDPVLPLSSNLVNPRYSKLEEEVLPSVNQMNAHKSASSEVIEEHESQGMTLDPIQDSWRAWFDHVEEAAVGAVMPRKEITEEEVVEEPQPAIMLEEEPQEVNVPVRAIHHSLYKPDEEVMLPIIAKNHAEEPTEDPVYKPVRARKGKNRLSGSLQLGGVLIATATLILAIVGSGYFDSYVLSHKQVSMLAGVSFYNK